MQFPFGPQLMGGPPVGPVPQIDLPSGFRPPGLMGGGAPNPMQPQGMAMGGIPYVPGLGLSKNAVGKTEPEGNMSGFPQGGGPQGPSGGALAPNPVSPDATVTAQPGQGDPAAGGSFAAWWSRNNPFKGLF